MTKQRNIRDKRVIKQMQFRKPSHKRSEAYIGLDFTLEWGFYYCNKLKQISVTKFGRQLREDYLQ